MPIDRIKTIDELNGLQKRCYVNMIGKQASATSLFHFSTCNQISQMVESIQFFG